jgi:hypothetical protein
MATPKVKSSAGENLKTALIAGTNAATGAVAGTMVIADKAIEASTKITGAAIDATAVLGTGTIEATKIIGKTALDVTGKAAEATGKIATTGLDVATKTVDATGKIATVGLDVATKTAEATGKIATTGLDVATKTAEASGKIANAATSAAADISSGALDATTRLSTAATKTAADIGVGALDATGKVATTSTKQVGDSLTAGINLAGNTTSNILNGLDGIRNILAKKAANQAAQTNQKLDAQAKAIAAKESTTIKNELLKAFEDLRKLTDATVTTLDGVQKTTLVGKMTVYKKVVCNIMSRVLGTCKSSETKGDLMRAESIRSRFLTATGTASQKAKTKVATGGSYDEIVEEYESSIATAVTSFVSEYEELHKKYDDLINEALAKKGAGRRKTYRKKKAKRVSRASRKRPSARGRSF